MELNRRENAPQKDQERQLKVIPGVLDRAHDYVNGGCLGWDGLDWFNQEVKDHAPVFRLAPTSAW